MKPEHIQSLIVELQVKRLRAIQNGVNLTPAQDALWYVEIERAKAAGVDLEAVIEDVCRKFKG